MKKFADLIGLLGIISIIYAILGRFLGGPGLGLGLLYISAPTGLVAGATLIIVALFLKSFKK